MAGLANQVPAPVKRRRSQELHALAARMKRSVLHRYLGRVVPVLWEAPDTTVRSSIAGYTPNYLRVRLQHPDRQHPVERIDNVRITALSEDGSGLLGCTID